MNEKVKQITNLEKNNYSILNEHFQDKRVEYHGFEPKMRKKWGDQTCNRR